MTVGLSVKEAAELTGIKPGVISALELNRRNIGLHSLMIFASTYGCSLDEIVFGVPSPSSDSTTTSDGPVEKMVEEEAGEERDPYYKSLKELTESMDDAEKDFMLRLIGTAHQEFAIVRNKMGS